MKRVDEIFVVLVEAYVIVHMLDLAMSALKAATHY
jgi:hypothetical protein